MSGGHVNMASYSWDSILKEIIQPLDYGATPHKVQFKRTLEEGAIQSTGLSNWMSFDASSEPAGDEDVEGSLDPSSEGDFKMIEKLTNVTANSEVLKSAV
jgi:hypothetical protein